MYAWYVGIPASALPGKALATQAAVCHCTAQAETSRHEALMSRPRHTAQTAWAKAGLLT
jgi:hypothetical protein